MNNRYIKYTLACALSILMLSETGTAQNYSRQKAVPIIKSFSPTEYNAHEQNFDITQDNRGYMYFANFAGILQYDGVNWKRIQTESGMRVLALDTDKKGTVFAAGLYDFGYLENDVFGATKYVSLAKQLDNPSSVQNVFGVHCLGERTYFVSHQTMYMYENETLSTIQFQNLAQSSYLVNDELFIFFRPDTHTHSQTQKGLTRFDGNAFVQPVEDAHTQIVDIQLMFSLPADEAVIIGTSKQGFFNLLNDTIRDIHPPVSDHVIERTLTCGTHAGDRFFALGTLTDGMVITDFEGNILQTINRQSKLPNEAINAVFTDKSELVWIAADYGISMVDLNNNISYIDAEISELSGRINKADTFNNSIFIASNEGLYYLSGNKIKKNPQIRQACHDFIRYRDRIVLATTGGLYIADSTQALKSSVTAFSFSLEQSAIEHMQFYVGQSEQILICSYRQNTIEIIETVKGFSGDIVNIKEDVENKLVFLENSFGKIYIYSLIDKTLQELQNIEDITALQILSGKAGPFFSSDKGLFIYDNSKKALINYNPTEKNASIDWIGNILFLPDNNFVFTDGERKNIAVFHSENQTINQTPFLPFANFSVNSLFFDQKYNNLWIGGTNTMLVYDYTEQKSFASTFDVRFTEIIDIKNDEKLKLNSDTAHYTKIRYSQNSLEFSYTLPHFPTTGTVKYRSFMQGFDRDTTEWTSETRRQFTNLPDKKYRLSIQAMNEHGVISGTAVYTFEIKTPLFRRWWALLIYLVILIGAVKLFIDYRMRAAQKERDVLEQIVKERTEEIEKSKEEIEAQRDMAYKQRKEIIDSINYAQRIQRAVLPSDEAIETILEDYFVFFKPYEIVSGDFFWMRKIKNYVAVAAADCTGHGVPGAFMSMLGSSFLNELVTRRSLDNAADILNRLRYKIKKSLHQEGKFEEQKDGMDISLYLLDLEAYELQFSGAYNPLYIIRHKDNITQGEIKELESNPSIKIYENNPEKTDSFIKTHEFDYLIIELKGNRQPIGIYVKETDFSNIVIKLKKGDTLYNFSDGFVDQFGGETGSKFKTKRFKELLLSVQRKPLEEQKRILEQAFYRWKGNQSQIDDIIIIAYRI